MRAKEIATACAIKICDKKEVQFLDDTVALKKISLIRDEGKISLLRRYNFEYSFNDEIRYNGSITVLATKIIDKHLDISEYHADTTLSDNHECEIIDFGKAVNEEK